MRLFNRKPNRFARCDQKNSCAFQTQMMGSRVGDTPGPILNFQERWVNAVWMPHSSLTQTSHVCLSIRSAHVFLDPLEPSTSKPSDLWVRVSLLGVGRMQLVPVSCHTPPSALQKRDQTGDVVSQPSVDKTTHECVWNYVARLPLRWRDLPRDTFVNFEIITHGNQAVYVGGISLFTKFGKLVTGLQRCDLSSVGEASPDDSASDIGLNEDGKRRDIIWESSQLQYELKRFDERGQAASVHFGKAKPVPWLDKLQQETTKHFLSEGYSDNNSLLLPQEASNSLIVEFPSFDVPVMHEETFYPHPQNGVSGAVSPLDLALYRKERAARIASGESVPFNPLQLVHFLDSENESDNPVEDKYRTLAHDLLRGLVDPALKPDRDQKQKLATIIDSPSHHPTREEKDLLWRFRFSLVDNKRALTKFLVAVDWTVDSEVVQAAELLEQWRKRSPIDVTDALKLLGKHVAYQTNLVRSYAIDTLAAASDGELRLYLLQLVQALKYENIDTSTGPASPRPGSTPAFPGTKASSLASFLIERAAQNIELANFLYWYMKVEVENPTHGAKYKDVLDRLKQRLSATPFLDGAVQYSRRDDLSSKHFKSLVHKIGSSFLPDQASKSVPTDETEQPRSIWDVLLAQDNFITGVMDIQLQCRDSKGKKDQKEGLLKSKLSDEGYDHSPTRTAIPLPSAPDIFVNGVNPSTVKMFKSALYPALIDFHVEGILKPNSGSVAEPVTPRNIPHATSYQVIVKTGDDLRQDQLIVMMTQLMDRLLKRAALDLCLMPYSVIATSPSSGFLEFIDDSPPISQVLAQNNGSVLRFFQNMAPLPGAKYNINPQVLSTYIRSCAGYSVVTYILGIGDRHLDNILLRKTGHFFHIDFGFAFGRDPKPLPPAFRLTREMVDGMGGTDSAEYRQFCSLACQAFNTLRKSATLVLNLLDLMSDANIEDLSNNPAADSEGIIQKVEERFKLELSDEQAEEYFQNLINDSLAAIAPRVMDVFHSFAVARR